jgi:TetR/AcrR family transcriptional regulator, cholesterol catabolism regulator
MGDLARGFPAHLTIYRSIDRVLGMSLTDVRRVAVARFAQRGFAAVGIRELGREVGLNSATLYHYAPSKEELLAGVMRDCLGELLAAAERELRTSADPVVQLGRLVQVHVAMSATNPLTCRVTDQEVRALTGTNRDDVLALRDRYEKMWQRVLARGVRSGAFLVPDLRLARLALLDMCNGIANWYDPAGRRSQAVLQRHFTDLACRAVGAAIPDLLEPVTVRTLDSEPLRDVRRASA